MTETRTLRPLVASVWGAGLMMPALALSQVWLPGLVLPLLLALWLALTSGLRSWKLALALTASWAVTRLTLLQPLPPLIHGFMIDHGVLQAANAHVSANFPAAEWLSWAIVAVLCLALPRASALGHGSLRAVFVGILLLSTCASLAQFNPAQQARFSMVKPSGYSHDHFLYQETWRRMKLGQDYYSAAAGAFHDDARGQGDTVRPPLVFYCWQVVPLPQQFLFWAFLGLTTVAMLSAWALSRASEGSEGSNWALLSPVVVVPYLHYGGVSAGYLFVEFWLLPLAFAAMACVWLRRWNGAVALSTLAFLGREFFGLLWLCTVAASVLAQGPRRKRALAALASLVVVAVYYLLHRSNSAWVLHSNNYSPPAPLLQVFAGSGWSSLKACLDYGLLLVPFPTLWLGLAVLAAGAGAWARLSRGERSTRVAMAGSLLYWLVFLLVGHRGHDFQGVLVFSPDYWGVILLLGWIPWVASGLRSLGAPED